MTPARAHALLERVGRTAPDVLTLARLASPAVRIEAALLRRLRRKLEPQLDVGVEADLWLSPLVSSRDTRAIVFHSKVAETLREDLADDDDTLERALAEIRVCHLEASPSIRLEEELIALALLGVSESETIERALAPALRAMAQGGAVSERVARWARRAIPGLPWEIRRSDPVRLLSLGSSAVLDTEPLLGEETLGREALERWAWALPEEALARTVEISVELRDGGLALGVDDPNLPTISLSDIRPRFARAEWVSPDGSGAETRFFDERAWIPLPSEVDRLEVVNLRGDVFILRSEVRATGLREVVVVSQVDERSTAMREVMPGPFREHGLEVVFRDASEVEAPFREELLRAEAVILLLSVATRLPDSLVLELRQLEENKPFLAVSVDGADLGDSPASDWLSHLAPVEAEATPESAARIAGTTADLIESGTTPRVRSLAQQRISDELAVLRPEAGDHIRERALSLFGVELEEEGWRDGFAATLIEHGVGTMGSVMEFMVQIGESDLVHRTIAILLALHVRRDVALRLLERHRSGLSIDAHPRIAHAYAWRAVLEQAGTELVEAERTDTRDMSLEELVDAGIERAALEDHSGPVVVLTGYADPWLNWRRSPEELFSIARRPDVRLVSVGDIGVDRPRAETLEPLYRDTEIISREEELAQSLPPAIDQHAQDLHRS